MIWKPRLDNKIITIASCVATIDRLVELCDKRNFHRSEPPFLTLANATVQKLDPTS